MQTTSKQVRAIKIEKAKTDDAHEIKKLLKETWVTTYSSIYSTEAIETITSEWHAVELLVQQINNPEFLFLVAKDGDKIVGMCNVSLTHQHKNINIQRIHVLPSHQRQEIGSNLMKEVFNFFPNAITVDLEVEKQNLKAQSFYKKLGFKICGEKTFNVKNIQINCFVMEKSLTNQL